MKGYYDTTQTTAFLCDGIRHPTKHIMDFWERHFKDIVILVLHEEVDILEQLVCQVLPRANNTCTNLRSRHVSTRPKKNFMDLFALEYERIAQYIHTEYGIGYERAMTSSMVLLKHHQLSKCQTGKYLEYAYDNEFYNRCEHLQEFPQICLKDSEIHDMLEISDKFEKEILTDLHSLRDLSSLEYRVKQAIDSKRYCWADLPQIFATFKAWKQWLNALHVNL